MSLLSPTSRPELSRSGWFLVAFLSGPMVLLFVFWWEMYLTFDAIVKVIPVAVLLGSGLSWMLYRRAVRLIELGLHPYVARGKNLQRKHVLAMVLGTILATWGWTLVVVALALLHDTQIAEKIFTISEVKDCTRKCLGCPTQLAFSDWVGADQAHFCADGLNPRPRVGERVLIRGRYTDLVQQVLALTQAGGA